MITTPETPDEPSFQLHACLECGHLVIRLKTVVDDSVMVTTYVVSMRKIETDRDRVRDEIGEMFTGAECYEPGQVVISGTEDAAEIIENLLPHVRFNRPGEKTEQNRLTKHFEEIEATGNEYWVVWNSQFQYWTTDGWNSSFSPMVQVYSDQEKAIIVADMLKAHGNPSAFAHRIPKP